MKPLQDQLAVIGPLLNDYRVHTPIWVVAATRIDRRAGQPVARR